MTREHIASVAAAGQLGVIVFVLVPQAHTLGVTLSIALAFLSSILVGLVAQLVVTMLCTDDPWLEVGLDPMWDTALDELPA